MYQSDKNTKRKKIYTICCHEHQTLYCVKVSQTGVREGTAGVHEFNEKLIMNEIIKKVKTLTKFYHMTIILREHEHANVSLNFLSYYMNISTGLQINPYPITIVLLICNHVISKSVIVV